MLGKSTSNMSLEELQKAVMGANPAIEPYQALAAIEKMVKAEKAKTAQLAQQPRPQGMVAQRTMAEAAALRNPYMAAGLGAAPVASPVTTPMGEQAAPVGMAGGGMVAFAKGGITPYESGFEALSDDERIAALQKYKEALGANNAELLSPLEAQQAKYAQEAEKTKKGGLSDALLAAGLGMMAGKSQYAMQNIGEGGLKGLAQYQESQKAAQMAQDKMLQSQADMAKSRIALEKGDETTAAALQNQARQEAQAAGQFKLQGQYYAGSNAAQMAAAQNRGLAGGYGADKQRLAELKLMLTSKQAELKDKSMMLPKNATRKAQLQGEVDELNKVIASMAGVGTMAPSTPGAGAAGGQNVYNFNDITKPQ
jgi:hypothetical protein